jgi:hypothetical protein
MQKRKKKKKNLELGSTGTQGFWMVYTVKNQSPVGCYIPGLTTMTKLYI